MTLRVLFATDGSEAAASAAEWLRRFPLPEAAELLVLTVATIPEPATLDVAEALEAGAREVAEAARSALAQRWPGAQARVVKGEPRPAILQAAEAWRADLVVLGARGLGAFAGMLLGSVSLGVARNAACPVLIAKGAPRAVRNVVVAVDDSRDSLAAARAFASLFHDPGTRVRLLSVAEPPRFPSSAPGMIRPQLRAAIDDIVGERKEQLEKALVALERELASGGAGLSLAREVAVGSPGEAVVETARTAAADLVVVGARGLGAFGRLLLGSVSEHVLHHASCPVLVVKSGSEKAA